MISDKEVLAREYCTMFDFLLRKVSQEPAVVLFVENIGKWCHENGINERDPNRPFLVLSKDGGGYTFVVREEIPESVIDERIRAVTIRDQVLDVAHDKGELLGSLRNRIAFLFLNEFARALPENKDDLLADGWTFDVMKRIGYVTE